MTRIDLMVTNGSLKEYRPMNWRRRRAYSRRVDYRLRYVCPPDMDWLALLETVFWLVVAVAAGACVVGFPIMFVRWWLGM